MNFSKLGGVLLSVTTLLCANQAIADMKEELLGDWDGKRVPKGQHCKLHSGNGSTPPMKVTNLPKGTVEVHIEFNDKNYPPLSSGGGHGIIGYPVSGSSADLYSVEGMKGKLKGKAYVVRKARSTGRYASQGYLPPCSGGRNNMYAAVVKAMDASNKVIEKVRLNIGRY